MELEGALFIEVRLKEVVGFYMHLGVAFYNRVVTLAPSRKKDHVLLS
jgi:hypothetical protein